MPAEAWSAIYNTFIKMYGVTWPAHDDSYSGDGGGFYEGMVPMDEMPAMLARGVLLKFSDGVYHGLCIDECELGYVSTCFVFGEGPNNPPEGLTSIGNSWFPNNTALSWDKGLRQEEPVHELALIVVEFDHPWQDVTHKVSWGAGRALNDIINTGDKPLKAKVYRFVDIDTDEEEGFDHEDVNALVDIDPLRNVGNPDTEPSWHRRRRSRRSSFQAWPSTPGAAPTSSTP